jgi:putative serine protease PepD
MSENDTNPQRYPHPGAVPQPPTEGQPTSELPSFASDAPRPVEDFMPGTSPVPPAGMPSAGSPAPVAGAAAPVAGHEPWTRPEPPTNANPPISGAPAGAPQAESAGTSPAQPIGASPAQPIGASPAQPVGTEYPTGQQPPIWQPAAPTSGYPQQPPYGMPPQPPLYGQPPYGGQPASKGSGVGKVIAIGLLALLLAGGGGLVGGLVVHAADGNGSSSSSPTHTTLPVLERNSLASIANTIKPSVVAIRTQNAEGSGVVLSSDGYVLTNNHVVADAKNGTLQVNFSNGKTVAAKVVGTDPKTDLAVVKASGVSGLTAAKFGDSGALQVGDTVLAVGSPLGLEGSVTEGIVSALNRTISEGGNQQQDPFSQQQAQPQATTSIAGAIQTDAAINPGNSGGALINLNAEVVGINTAIATSGQSNGNIGVGFAIPGNKAKQVAEALIKGQAVSHPYLGVNVGTADGNAGAVVASVVGNSPAAKASLKQGDVITKAGNTDIHTSDDLINVVQSSKVGDQLQLTVNRNGSSTTIAVTIGEAS